MGKGEILMVIDAMLVKSPTLSERQRLNIADGIAKMRSPSLTPIWLTNHCDLALLRRFRWPPE